MPPPAAWDLSDASAIADSQGNTGIVSSQGQMQIVIAERNQNCNDACLKITNLKSPCNKKETNNLNSCEALRSSVLCPRGCNYIVTDDRYHRDPKTTSTKDPRTGKLVVHRDPGFYYRGMYKSATFAGLTTSSWYYNGHHRVGSGVCMVHPHANVECGGTHAGIKRVCACGDDRTPSNVLVKKNTPPVERNTPVTKPYSKHNTALQNSPAPQKNPGPQTFPGPQNNPSKTLAARTSRSL